MERSITRRDFLDGVAIAVGGAAGGALLPELVAAALAEEAAQDAAGYYPPALTGLRGDHPGSFETAHALAREGERFAFDDLPVEESYDLVVVGGGISGLKLDRLVWAKFLTCDFQHRRIEISGDQMRL